MPRSSESSAEQDQLILGQALRSLRKRAGMTQEQVAERLGWTPPSSAASSAANAAHTGAPSAASSQPSRERQRLRQRDRRRRAPHALLASTRPDHGTRSSRRPNRLDARHSERCAIAVSGPARTYDSDRHQRDRFGTARDPCIWSVWQFPESCRFRTGARPNGSSHAPCFRQRSIHCFCQSCQ
jgi:hypothetical protein